MAARSAPDWFALGESPLRFDVEGEHHTIELRPTQLAPNVQALRLDRSDEFFPDFDAPLGVAYFASDGARLYAVGMSNTCYWRSNIRNRSPRYDAGTLSHKLTTPAASPRRRSRSRCAVHQ